MNTLQRGVGRLAAIRYPYESQPDRRKARALLIIGATFVVVGAALLIFNTTQAQDVSEMTVPFLSAVIAWSGAIASYILVQTGRLRAASRAITLAYFLAVSLFIASTGADRGAVLAVAIVVVLASALLSTTEVGVWAVACTVTILIIDQLQKAGVLTTQEVTFDLVVVGASTLLVDAVALWYFSIDHNAALREAIATARRLRATARISQIAAATLDLEVMLGQLVDQIREQFPNLYHVQIYLIDEAGAFADLQASTGDIGQALLDRRHRLEVGSQSVVGQVAATGEPLLVLEGDPLHRYRLFPDTQAQLGLPLTIGERLTGVLDVHGKHATALPPDDVEALRVTANQLAVAIENARLFAEQQRRAEESQMLLKEAQANLAEVERLNRRLTRQAWDEYLETLEQEVIGVTLDRDQTHADTAWTPALIRAVRESRAVAHEEGDRRLISAPVQLGGEIIGALEVELDAATASSDALEVVQAVATRLALTAQNVRLVEQSQRQAQREYRLGEIAGALQGQATVADMLSVAVSQLGRTLGAEHAAIRLGLRHTDTLFAHDQPDDSNGERGD
ncbi:MAG: GAF domain-containing protein [Anaerolineae bacterium]|nr:GAF domain-containing protein [Anaerolineae bacterium]